MVDTTTLTSNETLSSEVDFCIHHKSTQKDEYVKSEDYLPYPCDICSKSFKTDYGLQSHRHDSHKLISSNDKKIPCSYCLRVFKSPIGLQAHQQDSHYTTVSYATSSPLQQNDEKKLNLCPNSGFVSTPITNKAVHCEICHKQFRTSLDLHAHQRDAHNLIQPEDLLTNDSPIPCTQCHRVFKTNFNLRAHEKDAHLISPIQSEEVANNETKSIKLPNGTVTSKHIPCAFCAKVFRTEKNVQRHVQTVHSGIEIQCESCGKFLNSSVAMEQHYKAKHMPKEFIVAGKSD